VIYYFYWPHRLTVRTEASQASNPSAILGEVTKHTKQINYFICECFVKAQA